MGLQQGLDCPSFAEILDSGIKLFKEAGISNERQEAYHLISAVSERDIAWIIAHSDESPESAQLYKLIHESFLRRSKREPLAYILANKEFFGRDFKLNSHTLIPRPETEGLVEWVAEKHKKASFKQALDLCSGSGAIGITLSAETGLPFELWDISQEALNCSKENALKHRVAHLTQTLQIDILKDELPTKEFDLITMNPPYISPADLEGLEPEVRDFEPKIALDGGEEEGLSFFLLTLARLHKICAPLTHLYVELGMGQIAQIEKQTLPAGWAFKTSRLDLCGIERVLELIYKRP